MAVTFLDRPLVSYMLILSIEKLILEVDTLRDGNTPRRAEENANVTRNQFNQLGLVQANEDIFLGMFASSQPCTVGST